MMWYERPLVMSVADICKEYREAKNPDKQLPILAELNDTQTTRIAYLLARAGENVKYKYLPRTPRSPEGVNLSEIWDKSPEAAEADAVRSNRAELAGSTVEAVEAVEAVEIVNDITACLWTAVLPFLSGRRLDADDVENMMGLREIAERIGGDT